MEFLIREIEPRDNPVVTEIIRNVMAVFNCIGDGYSSADPEVDAMSEYYHPPLAAFYVVEVAGKVLGCAGIAPLEGGDNRICELRKMYFLPELRSTGAGHALLQHCLLAARTMGYKYCYLETMQDMLAARKLYYRAGFADLSQPMGQTGHGYCEMWLGMEL